VLSWAVVVVGLAYPLVVELLLAEMVGMEAHLHRGGLGLCEDGGDLLADWCDSRGSLAGCLCRAPILACRSRNSRSGMWGQLLQVSISISYGCAAVLHRCPIGGGGGGEGVLPRRPMFAVVMLWVKFGVGVKVAWSSDRRRTSDT
jgi:hypothetical protein